MKKALLICFIWATLPHLYGQGTPGIASSTYLPFATGLTAPRPFAPNALGAFNSSGNGCVFSRATFGNSSLARINADGTIVYTISGLRNTAGIQIPRAIFMDEQNICYVAGDSAGIPSGFPNPTIIGNADENALVRLSPSGTILSGTFFGGSSGDMVSGLAVDNFGIYVTGATPSGNFPLKNSLTNLVKGVDAFVVKLDPSGANLIYSTVYGGSGADTPSGFATDANGNAYITGSTDSTDVPMVPGGTPFQATNGSAFGGFAAKFGPNGELLYSTYFAPGAIAADAAGNAYIAANSHAGFPFNSPQTAGGFFVGKLNPSGSALIYSTPLSADFVDPVAIQVDAGGQAHIGGSNNETVSPSTILLVNPIQRDPTSAFVATLDATGTLVFSTFLGAGGAGFVGPPPDAVTSLGLDNQGNRYVVGLVAGLFPLVAPIDGTVPRSFSPDGAYTGFLTKISPGPGAALAAPSKIDFSAFHVTVGAIFNPGPVALIANVSPVDIQLTNFSVSGDFVIDRPNPCPATLLAGRSCLVELGITATGFGTRTGSLTITSSAPDSPRVIPVIAVAKSPALSPDRTQLTLTSPSVGTAGLSQAITLQNSGDAAATLTSISIVGPSASDFSEIHDCNAVLPLFASCLIRVTYTPSGSVSESATLQVVDNAPGSPHTVALTGMVGLNLALASGSAQSQTISAGQTAVYNFTVGGAGQNATLALRCSGAPTGVTCSVPSSQTVSTTTPSSFQVTVSTTARTTGALVRPNIGSPRDMLGFAVFVALLPGLVVSVKSRRGRLLLLSCVCLSMILLGSCGGGGSPSTRPGNPTGTPAGSYTISVMATSQVDGSSQTANVTLNVN
ncbi:MAG: hypothetical protein JWN45_2976 [Acidobacteriaceae bacterium]|nr:hypothetical protein [Acidobacteriaceae bacterium]